jgi:hypothetical protein
MSSKQSAKAKRRPASSASLSVVLTQNLANMATVFASSGSVLLCLLIAKRFA